MLRRAVRSVENQTLSNWEHIIVDDGSVIPISEDLGTKVLKQPHLERIIAYNKGLREAKGKWICFLDSDDEYVSYYLEAVSAMIKKYPTAKIFNFGSIHLRENYYARTRDAFKPKKEEVGHERFGGGNIVNGTFVFHHSLYDELGAFPETCSPWDFSTMAQEELPELKELFMVNHKDEPKKIVRELGNPWGQDYYLFYKYTRKYHSIPFDCHLYIVHPSRIEHKL